MEQIDESVAIWSDDFVFGQVWAGEDLEWSERTLVAITALAALGNEVQLRNYVHGALQDGVPEAKLRQAFRMLTVYAGFPVAIRALYILTEACEVEARAAARSASKGSTGSDL
jgi:4-carboxymuconolactone decarboxylase